jgi:hypothetical protein
MKKILLISMLSLLSLSSFADFRIWESTDGNIWEGEFVTLNGGMVVIQDQSGNKGEVDPEKLCAADLAYLEQVVPPNLSLDVSRSTDGTTGSSEMVKCIASIKKSDTRRYTGELTAVLVVMAEELRTGAFSRAGASKEFKFVLPEKNGVPVTFESDSVRLLKRSNKSGRAYSGYVLVVWDRFGNPIAMKSNRDSFLENAAKIAPPKYSPK